LDGRRGFRQDILKTQQSLDIDVVSYAHEENTRDHAGFNHDPPGLAEFIAFSISSLLRYPML
jgi:hypothetical protein